MCGVGIPLDQGTIMGTTEKRLPIVCTCIYVYVIGQCIGGVPGLQVCAGDLLGTIKQYYWTLEMVQPLL